MSQETVDLVKLGFEALLRGDVAAVQANTTRDVAIVQPPEVPDSKTYEGRAAILEMLEDWPRQWEDFRLDLVELSDVSDDTVVSVSRHRGRGRESGIEMDFQVFYVHRLRDRKLARLEMFFSREQALEAARLSE